MFVYQNVLWFYITVYDSLGMEMADSHEKLVNVDDHPLLWQAFALRIRQSLKQVFAFDVLHDQVKVLIIHVNLVILDNIGVLQSFKFLNFVYNLINLICDFTFFDNLDGDRFVFITLASAQIDVALCSMSQNL